MDESQSYLTATKHRECYNGLIKSYDLDKSLFSTYDKVYLLKRSQKDKDKDEDPSARSDRGLKKRKTSKDAEPTKGPKTKESKFGSSKGTKSQSKSSRKSAHAVEPEFKNALEYDFEECYKALSEKTLIVTVTEGVTQFEVMRKHRTGYLREIKVQRADNELYTFKEGDFPRLRINAIKDMLILVV
ncbi:hypothetical protein Tco_1354543 [Tanacetum coccineum]